MTRNALKPTSTRRAADEMRRLIFAGELAPGTDHLETELATRLGLSRTPIREAALMLEAQGLMEVRPRKGVRILPISPEDMREVYEVLTELECLAAEKAAARDTDAAELAPLQAAIDEMDAALAREDREGWAAADDRFHAALMGLARNARAEAVVAMMADQVLRARTATLWARPVPTKSNEDHRAVLDAIRDGDGAAARALHRAHREGASRMLLDLIERHRLMRL